MFLESMRNRALFLLLLVTIFRGSLSAQTVPPFEGEGGTVRPTSSAVVFDQSPIQISAVDTLELHLLEIEIKRQEEKMMETSFWRRIIPRIHFSASFGMRDLMSIDPASFTPYILPRDAYRLTITLSLNDVLVSPSHTQVVLELERLRGMLSVRRMQFDRAGRILEQQLAASQGQLKSLEEELVIVQELLHFNELRFQQGRIEFDVLARTKLELLGVQRYIQRVQQQQSEIRLRLSTQ
jgi:hypothetical protein